MINENGDIKISIPEENNEIMKFMKDSHLKRIINSDHQRTLAAIDRKIQTESFGTIWRDPPEEYADTVKKKRES